MPDVPRLSPVEVSARFLRHLGAAFGHSINQGGQAGVALIPPSCHPHELVTSFTSTAYVPVFSPCGRLAPGP